MPILKDSRSEQVAVVVPTDTTKPNVLAVVVVDPEGTFASSGVGTTAYALAPGDQAASNAGSSFPTLGFNSLSLDINLTAFTGGTAPTITFFVERQGNDAVWYRVWQSAAQNAAAKLPVTIGPQVPTVAAGANVSQGVTAGLTATARFGWSTTGTPTSVTFSASIVGR